MKSLLRVLCMILALCTVLSVTACGGKSWRDDLTAREVCNSITTALSSADGWRTVSESYISPSSWGEDYADYLAKVSEYTIVVSENSESNIDEVGVFLCKTEKDAASVKKFAESYLEAKKLQLTPLLESYNPDELPKLDYATVQVMGRYVMYSILRSSDTTVAGSTMEKTLTPAA